MAVLNNLYPPVIDTYMPAFLVSEECRIYFSISQYNNIEEINHAQLTLVNLNTNLTVLDSTLYPSEVKLCKINIDTTRETDDKYYIIVKDTDLENGFTIDTYYKAQVRFSSAEHSLSTPQKIDTWLAENLDNFSEWSSVCLIRGISDPELLVSGFGTEESSISWSMVNTDVIGKLVFEEETENEVLKSYQIKLYRKASDRLLTDSGLLYTTEFIDPNSFVYTFQYAFEENASYYFTIDYTTSNGYKGSAKYAFRVTPNGEDAPSTDIALISDKDNGRIGVKLTETPSGDEMGITRKLMIRRTSSNSNFTIWEDINYVEFDHVVSINSTWYDTTIESGVWYKYCIQTITDDGRRGAIKITNDPMMVEFEDMFLTVANRQLRIQFNPNVSSMKKMLSESKVDTIGSKYPFIRKNGYMEYLQFPISGLISALMDEDYLFATEIEIYGDEHNKELYQSYNVSQNIQTYTDFIYEKKFRDLVSDFLYNSEPKLFRSPTEGNILVKVMDVSLSPETVLSRMIWTFNGTAYEIGDTKLETLEKNNIINKKIEKNITKDYSYEDSIR